MGELTGLYIGSDGTAKIMTADSDPQSLSSFLGVTKLEKELVTIMDCPFIVMCSPDADCVTEPITVYDETGKIPVFKGSVFVCSMDKDGNVCDLDRMKAPYLGLALTMEVTDKARLVLAGVRRG